MQRDYEIKLIMCIDLDPSSFGLFYLFGFAISTLLLCCYGYNSLASLANINIISTGKLKYKSYNKRCFIQSS